MDLQAVNWQIVGAILTVVALVSYLRWIAPKIKRKNDLYQEVILVLSIVGVIYQDDAVEKVTDSIKDVILNLKELGEDISKDKILTASKEIVETLKLEVENDVLELIVNTVIYYLG